MAFEDDAKRDAQTIPLTTFLWRTARGIAVVLIRWRRNRVRQAKRRVQAAKG
jgi:hypothetical protein